jgi:hypothetical protein
MKPGDLIQKTGIPVMRLALTASETAAALGIKETTLWRLTKRGLLHPNRSTRRPLYAVSEIERFLKAGTI